MKLEGRIYLIGMPGSGKSYFGRMLKDEIHCEILDLDHEIEETEGCTITEMFSEKGEAYFREAESRMLKSLSEKHENVIISTGGGTPCFHDGINYMKQNGVVVFLETPREVLVERLARKDHRPLVQGDVEKRVDDLLAARLPIYSQAHIAIEHRDVDLFKQQIAEV